MRATGYFNSSKLFGILSLFFCLNPSSYGLFDGEPSENLMVNQFNDNFLKIAPGDEVFYLNLEAKNHRRKLNSGILVSKIFPDPDFKIGKRAKISLQISEGGGTENVEALSYVLYERQNDRLILVPLPNDNIEVFKTIYDRHKKWYQESAPPKLVMTLKTGDYVRCGERTVKDNLAYGRVNPVFTIDRAFVTSHFDSVSKHYFFLVKDIFNHQENLLFPQCEPLSRIDTEGYDPRAVLLPTHQAELFVQQRKQKLGRISQSIGQNVEFFDPLSVFGVQPKFRTGTILDVLDSEQVLILPYLTWACGAYCEGLGKYLPSSWVHESIPTAIPLDFISEAK